MSCQYVQERISPLLDHQVDPEERGTVLAHIECCRACSAHYESMVSVRAALRSVNSPPVPAQLGQKLRVLASHEHARQVSRLTMKARVEHWRSRMGLVFDNIMRPFGLPAASGLVSAVLLFALLAPSLSFARRTGKDDPTDLVTMPQFSAVSQVFDGLEIEDPAPAGAHFETVLELQISPEGKVWNWRVVQGNRDLTPDVKQMILLQTFNPATFFGRPTWGTVTVGCRHQFHYIVRG